MKYRKHLDKVERVTNPHIDDNLIRLNSAERDIPLDTTMWNLFLNNLKETDVRYYPNVNTAINKIAWHEGVEPNQVTIGAGSDQVIRNIFECFVNPWNNVVTTDPCFPMYFVYGGIYNFEVKKVPYRRQKVDVTGILNAIDFSTSIVIVSNPNSPIGDSFTKSDLESIIHRASDMSAIVVIDEAYIQFATDTVSLADTAWSYNNLIVVKTFSKAVGAAGIRFGYCIANTKITELLNKVKSMYEITGPTIKWVETVVDNYHEIALYSQQVKHNRQILSMSLSTEYEVVDSECNWIHTTKTDFPDHILTRQCTLPWSDKTWTRLCIPANLQTLMDIS
jgi:histidinol-phosphate aminotransferase